MEMGNFAVPPATAQDLEQLRMLRIGHIVVGVITGLFSLVFLVHIGMGVAMLSGSWPAPMSAPVPPGTPGPATMAPPFAMGGFLFVAMGLVFLVAGEASAGLNLYAARCLREQRRHTLCIVASALNIINVPVGTALGVLTLIVLARPGVKQLFSANQSGPG